jgi:rod shape-determining protein MreD
MLALKMRHWIFLIIIIVFGLLQATLLDYFKIFGIKPDLLLISVVYASVVFEFRRAFALSLFAGIFKDVFGVSPLGINTLMFGLLSLAIIRLNREITIDYNLIRVGLIFIVCLIQNIIMGLLLVYLGKPVSLGIILRIVSVGPIYTALVSLLVLKLSEGISYGE